MFVELDQCWCKMKRAEEQHKTMMKNSNEANQRRINELTQINEEKIQQLLEATSRMNQRDSERSKQLQEATKKRDEMQREIFELNQKWKTAESQLNVLRNHEEKLKSELGAYEQHNTALQTKLSEAIESSRQQKEKIRKILKQNHYLLNAKNELEKEVSLPYLEETARTWYTDHGITLTTLLGVGSSKVTSSFCTMLFRINNGMCPGRRCERNKNIYVRL